MKFIGRTEEQKVINALLNDETRFRSCVVYGRRRLGKIELLKHLLLKKGKPCVFFSAVVMGIRISVHTETVEKNCL